MARIRVKAVGKGTLEDPLRVNLPTYTMMREIAEDKTVEVIVPDDEVGADGKPDKDKIRRKYKGQPRWDRPDILGDI